MGGDRRGAAVVVFGYRRGRHPLLPLTMRTPKLVRKPLFVNENLPVAGTRFRADK
jgi:hypothetical protein